MVKQLFIISGSFLLLLSILYINCKIDRDRENICIPIHLYMNRVEKNSVII